MKKGVPLMPRLPDGDDAIESKIKFFQAKRAWKLDIQRDFADTLLDSLKQADVKRLFDAFDLVSSGAGETLCQWRWEQFCKGNPVRRTIPKEPPVYFLAPHSTDYESFRGTLLSIPVGIVYTHILKYLYPWDVFSTMKTCRQLQAISHQWLTREACITLQTPNATPMALHALLKMHRYPISTWCQKQFGVRDNSQNSTMIVQHVIKRYNFFDYYKMRPDNELADSFEKDFISAQSGARLECIESLLKPWGLHLLRWRGQRVFDWVKRFSLIQGRFLIWMNSMEHLLPNHRFLQHMIDYVTLKTDKVPVLNVKKPELVRAVLDLLEKYPVLYNFPLTSGWTGFFVWLFALYPHLHDYMDSWARGFQLFLDKQYEFVNVYWSREFFESEKSDGPGPDCMVIDHPHLKNYQLSSRIFIYLMDSPAKRIKCGPTL